MLPFHGRKRLRERARGAEVGLKDELSLTHTCSFPSTLSPSALVPSLSLSLSLTSCCLSHSPSSPLLFCSFTFFSATISGDPLLLQPGGAYISQRALQLGLWGGRGLRAQSPIFICLIFERTLPGKREMDRPRVCVCVCLCVYRGYQSVSSVFERTSGRPLSSLGFPQSHFS